MRIKSQAAHFIRWNDWGPGKVTLLCSLCFYVAAADRIEFSAFVVPFLQFLLFASAQSALGFVLNNWGDRELDRREGKPNAFNENSPRGGALGLALTLAVALVTGIPFIPRPFFMPLWVLWLVAAVSYSLEPLRFKTRGLAGLAISFIAQWSLPVFITFAVFGQWNRAAMWLLALALTVSGATLEIAHQRHDVARDAAVQAQTFAVRWAKKLDQALAICLLFDKAAIGVLTVLVAFAIASLESSWSLVLAIGDMLLYLMLLIPTLPSALAAVAGHGTPDPYYDVGRSAAQLLHQTLPNLVLPMSLGLALTLNMPPYGILLVLFGFWRIALGRADWRWPLRLIRAGLGGKA